VRLSLSFAKAYTGELHLYAVDWDSSARRELIGVDGQTAELSSSFNAGAWVSFPISVGAGETVPIVVDHTAGSNAVLSGVFIGGSGSPATVASESKPQGSWVASYGSKGYDLAAWNGSSDLVEMPTAEVTLTQGSRYQWAASTSEARALQSPEKTTREAATYFDPNQLRISLKFHLGLHRQPAPLRRRLGLHHPAGDRQRRCSVSRAVLELQRWRLDELPDLGGGRGNGPDRRFPHRRAQRRAVGHFPGMRRASMRLPSASGLPPA